MVQSRVISANTRKAMKLLPIRLPRFLRGLLPCVTVGKFDGTPEVTAFGLAGWKKQPLGQWMQAL